MTVELSWKAVWRPVCVGVAVALFKVSFKLHPTVSSVEGEKRKRRLGGGSDPTALFLLPLLFHFSVPHPPRLWLVPGVCF